jgi:hypothetical protein
LLSIVDRRGSLLSTAQIYLAERHVGNIPLPSISAVDIEKNTSCIFQPFPPTDTTPLRAGTYLSRAQLPHRTDIATETPPLLLLELETRTPLTTRLRVLTGPVVGHIRGCSGNQVYRAAPNPILSPVRTNHPSPAISQTHRERTLLRPPPEARFLLF